MKCYHNNETVAVEAENTKCKFYAMLSFFDRSAVLMCLLPSLLSDNCVLFAVTSFCLRIICDVYVCCLRKKNGWMCVFDCVTSRNFSAYAKSWLPRHHSTEPTVYLCLTTKLFVRKHSLAEILRVGNNMPDSYDRNAYAQFFYL